MNSILVLLFFFVALGLLSDRLKRYTWVLMALGIFGYVGYAYLGH